MKHGHREIGPSLNEFSLRMRTLRILKGLDQKEVAERCGGYSRAWINLIENGKRRPTLDGMIDICDALRLTNAERASLVLPLVGINSDTFPVPVALLDRIEEQEHRHLWIFSDILMEELCEPARKVTIQALMKGFSRTYLVPSSHDVGRLVACFTEAGDERLRNNLRVFAIPDELCLMRIEVGYSGDGEWYNSPLQAWMQNPVGKPGEQIPMSDTNARRLLEKVVPTTAFFRSSKSRQLYQQVYPRESE